MLRANSAKREIHPPRNVVERIVSIALEEDLGRGDVTTEACVPRSVRGEATFRARVELTLAGVEVVKEVYRQVDAEVEVHDRARDGDRVGRGEAIGHVVGRATSLLAGERVALNFLQRLSGIATLTQAYVGAVPAGLHTRITGTRKTTPGLRALERYAIRCGGGFDHREDLSSSVLIKDNHIAAAGGIRPAVERARAHVGHLVKIEVEVDTLEQLAELLATGADAVLLDNMDPATLRRAVELVDGRMITEASGRITAETARAVAQSGVDLISVGWITHSAPVLDIGLDARG